VLTISACCPQLPAANHNLPNGAMCGGWSACRANDTCEQLTCTGFHYCASINYFSWNCLPAPSPPLSVYPSSLGGYHTLAPVCILLTRPHAICIAAHW
jgi:hypothetical protein